MTSFGKAHTNPKTKIRPKKSLGQNFLVDKNVINKIISSCDFKKTDTVLEIGPGTGLMTRELAPLVKMVIAIETDRFLTRGLNNEFSGKNVKAVHGDILKYDFSSLPEKAKLVGNLPYYISSPILERIISNRKYFSDIFITVQHEFGKRMVAKPSTKDYSSLTLFVKYYADAKILFKIKNTSFKPQPKVQSCFMRLKIRKRPQIKVKNEDILWSLVRCAFQQRRKTILNSLSKIIEKKDLKELLHCLRINSELRAENLELNDFVNIADKIT